MDAVEDSVEGGEPRRRRGARAQPAQRGDASVEGLASTSSVAFGRREGEVGGVIVAVGLSYSVIVNFLAMFPSTMCLKIAGGSGCG